MNPTPPHTGFPPPQPPPPFAVPPPLFPYSVIPSAPFPPPIPTSSAPSDLPSALSSLTSVLELTQSTLTSFSSLLPIPSPISPPLARCPFNPNHLIPPPYLFSHYLSCTSSSSSLIDPELFLSSLHYLHTLQLPPDTQQLEYPHSSELCFSLDEFFKIPDNFYSDCPGAVIIDSCRNDPLFSHPMLMLPRFLSAECANYMHIFRSLDENYSNMDYPKLLASEIWDVKFEINNWNEYPCSYSSRVHRLFNRLRIANLSHLHEWILVNSPTYGVVIDSPLADHIVLLFKLSLKAMVTESINTSNSLVLDPNSSRYESYDMKFECPNLVETMRWFGSQLSILYGEVNAKSYALDMLKQSALDSASSSSIFPLLEKTIDSPINHDVSADEDITNSKIYVSQVAAAVAALHERYWLELKIKALRDPQPQSAYQRKVEYEHISRRANEERQQRPDYKPVIEHDGFLWQRSNNQDPNRIKTREELLAEERDYKRRRTSYRGKKMKRSTTQVMRDIIDEYMEEIKKVHGLLKASGEGESWVSESSSSRDGHHLSTISLAKNKREEKVNRGEQHDPKRITLESDTQRGDSYKGKVKNDRSSKRARYESDTQRGDSYEGKVKNDRSSKRARYDRDYSRSPRHQSESSHSRSERKHNDHEDSTRRSDRSYSKSDKQKNHHQRKGNESQSENRNSRRSTRGHRDIKSGTLHTEFEDRYYPSVFNDC